jgi:hypothetical protein
MASSVSIEEKFNASVKAIQHLPANGEIKTLAIAKIYYFIFYQVHFNHRI